MKRLAMYFVLITFLVTGCDTLEKMAKQAAKDAAKGVITPGGLTDSEIISGLKDALNVGTINAVGALSRDGGFLNNPGLKIPFPQDVKVIEDKLRQVGMGKMVDDFIVNMNKGASEAVKEASPIFTNAIKQMTFADARKILGGADNAATEYFKSKTTAQLTELFKPKVQQTLDRMSITKYWTDITSAYNKIPLTTKVDTDLNKYVTDRAIAGLFTTIAGEEKKIRTDPAARVTDILKKVFAK